MSRCEFSEAWKGQCQNKSVDGEDYCEEHIGLKCSSCGEQATHPCHQTMGAFVCGANLCDKCEHKISKDGTNGMTGDHCRKDEQEYLPWYERDNNK